MDDSKPEKEQLKTFQQYKMLFTLIEIISFALLIIFGLYSLIDLIFYPKYELFEFFKTPGFIITIISAIIFIFSPTIIKLFAIQGRKFIEDLRISQFKQNFKLLFKENREFDFNKISIKFRINPDEIRRIFEDFLAKGIIKGNLIGKKFILAEGFDIKTEEEINYEKFQKSIIDYVKPYRWLNISQTAKVFKVSQDEVTLELNRLINEGKITGFLDGDNLVRELGIISSELSDLPECPYCDKKVLTYSKYCSNCGEKINFDKIMLNGEIDDQVSEEIENSENRDPSNL